MWMDVEYEPGELKVVAYDKAGIATSEKIVSTAGMPHHIKLEADRSTLSANGDDLSFITATIVDKNGLPCPTANNRLKFQVEGEGNYKAACNGDATSLEPFHLPTMKAFNGKLVVLIQSTENKGEINLTVSGDELEDGHIKLISQD
jgi:beta-galactosidase